MKSHFNNKNIGAQFEKELCAELARRGFWVHFITPDSRGAQPFDIVAVKEGKAYAIDCKTCVAKTFDIKRLEDNQVCAFERWLACGNIDPIVAVKHEDGIYFLSYKELKEKKRINLEADCEKIN